MRNIDNINKITAQENTVLKEDNNSNENISVPCYAECNAESLSFLDMIAPGVIDFKVDYYICGNTYRCVWAVREYPTATDEQAILRNLGEMDGVTLKIEMRRVTAAEETRS